MEKQFEEGDECPFCEKGILEYGEVKDCSCHISAPCSGHTDQKLTCDYCGCEATDGD